MNSSPSASTWLETNAGQQLTATLSKEEVTSALTRIVKRMDTLESAVNRLADMLEKGPGMASMVTDMVDEGYRNAAANGVDIEARLKNALALAEKLTAPEMVEKLDSIITLSNQAPGLIAMFADMADENMAKLQENGALERITEMINPDTMAAVGNVGHALTEAQKQPIQKVGLMGMLRAFRNPDMQNAMGFLINFARNFGKTITKS